MTLSDIPTDPAYELSASTRRRGLVFLGLAVAMAGATMGIQAGLNFNFMVEVIGADGLQMGGVEAARETCGITALLILALLAGLGEPLVASFMLMILAVGIGSYAFVPNFAWVVAMSMVWSQGLHVWMPLPHSMTLALSEPGRSGHRLGQIHAAGAAGFGGGIAIAWVLNHLGVAMRPMYIVAGVLAVFGAWACFGIPRKIKTPGPRFVFRKKYGLYYLLCFLEGWRRQIFMAFSGFLLVKKYGTPLGLILILWLVVQFIGLIVSPRVGKLIDRIGERKILLFNYICLTFFFLGYAFIPSVIVLYALFVIDSAFFVFALALTTYVNKIAPKSEHTATLSAGVAMSHIAAVTMPLIGGLLWVYLSYQWTFLVGAFAAAVSIFVVRKLPLHLPNSHDEGPPTKETSELPSQVD